MKLWTSEHTFEHPWETVAKAAWRKYPNPMNPGVTGIDVLNRSIDSRGRLESHRLLITKWSLPSWVHTMLGTDATCFGSEVSLVDPKSKTLELRTTNLTLHDYLSIDETLVYSPHPSNKNHTLLKQEASINVKGLPLSGYLEGVVVGNIDNNAGKGRQAMEWAISNIKSEMEELAKTAQTVSLTAQKELTKTMQFIDTEPYC
ncbi:SLMO2 [Bugula neritina]|uniref:SLMO2 n=1 Tax=Bugula neritina TaxID=10212 RepID=A0A7J7J0T0_BUGNE|nr:SLMO2 [Bugula neritina]KAF6031340.1 SLMO2 [Bugula neritina]